MKSITIKALALVGGVSITAIVVPSVTFGAVSNVNQQNNEMINKALETIKQPTLTAEATQILPSVVNDKNINQYVVAPTVNSQTAQVTLSTKAGGADDTKGTLIVVVSIGWGSITQSKDFTLSGFEVSQNALSNDMKAALNLIQIKAVGATVLPSQITNSNISDYLVTPPTSANGTVFSLSIPTTNSYNNVNGTLNLILKGTLNGISSSLDVSLASYNGISFLDNSTALSNALKNVTFLATTSQISTILPGQITDANLSTYINTPVATQDGLITYSISNPTNANSASQSLEVTLTATLTVDGQSTSQNKLITITGFILPTAALTNALKNITTLSLTPAGESLTPSQITSQDQLNSAINIPSAISNGLITYSLSLPSTPSYDDTTGTLNVILSANISGVPSQNKTIVISGFHTTSNNLSNALNSITTLAANAEGAKVMTSVVTSNNLSTYVDTPANTSDNVSFTIALVPGSSDVAKGTISVVLTAHFDNQTSSKTITVTGFLQSASALSDALAKITTLVANAQGAKVITPLVTTETLATYVDTPTTTSDGVSFSIVLAANSGSVTNGTVNVTLTAILGSETDSKTISVTGFLTGSQALTNYLNAFGSGLVANATGAALLATQVNKDLSTLNTYLTMPDLSNVDQNGLITYEFSNPSTPDSGSFKVDVNATLSGITSLAPKTISLTGFLTANEALTAALQNITSLSVTSEAANIIASEVNNDNINTYINAPKELSNGITFSIQVSPSSANNINGTINVIVQAKLVVNPSLTVPQTKVDAITVGGFQKLDVALKNALDNITNLTTTSSISNILPGQIIENNINTYIDTPKTLANGISFSLSNPIANNIDGTLEITLTASLDKTNLTKVITISSRFLSASDALTNALKNVDSSSITLTDLGQKTLPSVIAIASNNTDINKYFNLINSTQDGFVSYEITISSPNNANDVNGTLDVTIIASIAGVGSQISSKQSKNITLSNLYTYKDISTSIIAALPKNISLNTTTTNDYALQINSGNITSFFETPLSIPNGYNYIYTISANNSANAISAGSLTLKIQALFGSTTGTTSTNAQTYNLSGFKQGYLINASSQSVTNGALSNLIMVLAKDSNIYNFMTSESSSNADLSKDVINALASNSQISSNLTLFDKTTGIIWPSDHITYGWSTTNDSQSTDLSATTTQLYVKVQVSNSDFAMYDVNDFGTIQAYLSPVLSKVTNNDINLSSTASGAFPKAINSESTFSSYVLGFNTSSLPSNGITYNIQWNPNQTEVAADNGEVIATLSATFKNVTITQDFTITGFLSKDKEILTNIINQFNANPTTSFTVNSLGASTTPSTITAGDLDKYISNNFIPTDKSIAVSYVINSSSDAAGTMNIDFTLSLGLSTFPIDNVKISGFKSDAFTQNSFESWINSLNLNANSAFSAPQITSSASLFENSESILNCFDLTSSQIAQLSVVTGLAMKVTNSKNGNATIEFSAPTSASDSTVLTYSKEYTGWFTGDAAQIKESATKWFQNTTNAANFLQNYLSINSTWLSQIINNDSGSGYWSYMLTGSNSELGLKNIQITYDSSLNVFVLKGVLTHNLVVSTWDSSANGGAGAWVSSYTSPSGQSLMIYLPMNFDANSTIQSNSNYYNAFDTLPLQISVNSTGNIYLNWPYVNGGTQWQDVSSDGHIFGLSLNVYSGSNIYNMQSINVSWRLEKGSNANGPADYFGTITF